MRLRSAIARAVLWGGLGCPALAGAAWAFSLFRTVEYAPAGVRSYALAGGCLSTDIYFRSRRSMTVLRAPGEAVWYLQAARPLRWWFQFEGNPWTDHVAIPLWAVAALGMGAARVGGMVLARPTPGQCRRCGYDLSALAPGSICPECGPPSRRSPFRGRSGPPAAPEQERTGPSMERPAS